MVAALFMISMDNKVKEMKYFEEDYQVFDLDELFKT